MSESENLNIGANAEEVEDCCAVPATTSPAPNADASDLCPHCGHLGKPVQEATLKTILTPSAMLRRQSGGARFCQTRDCPVAYFGTAGRFEIKDVQVAVFQKSDAGDTSVCYCFGHTRDSIAQQVAQTGFGPASAISAKVKAGLCACELRNPQGSCCLGNVAKVVSEVKIASKA